MNTTHDLEATSWAPTSYAPRGDDATVASAWSSSPLGNPAHDAGYAEYADPAAYPADGFSDFADFAAEPTTVTRRPRFVSKGVLAAGLIATVGVGAALTFALSANMSQPRNVAVAAPSTAAPVAAPAAMVPAPVQTAPASAPAPAPVADVPANIPAPAPVVTPPPDNGPPPPDPGPPPAAPPAGPVVIVNPPPVWLPPVHPPVPWQPPAPPKLPQPPKLCLPPHHFVGGVCK